MEQDSVTLYGSFSIGASGAVGTVRGGGIKAVVKKTDAGQYEVELQDRYARVLSIRAGLMHATISQISNIQVLENPANFQADVRADGKFVIQCVGATAADNTALIAKNPEQNAVISLVIVLRKSSLGPYDG